MGSSKNVVQSWCFSLQTTGIDSADSTGVVQLCAAKTL